MIEGRGCWTPTIDLVRVFYGIFEAELLGRAETAMIKEAKEVSLAPVELGSNVLDP